MLVRETLILSVTRMLGGVGLAGMTTEPDPVTLLQWVRPVREHGHVLLGDITTADGTVIRPFDVAELSLVRPQSIPPHTEDWITDFARRRPRVVRRLRDHRRAAFLSKHLDTAPSQVPTSQERSLCLVRPDWVKGTFRLDSYSGQLEGRISFGLDGKRHLGSHAKGGLSVTDLKWRAMGREWLPADGGWTDFDAGDLETRLDIEAVYLVVGLARSHKRSYWPVIVGVHTLPDYSVTIDYDNL
jgi:hypothetical protein